jgi:hypothetical protein
MISFCKNKPKENGNFNIFRPVTSSTSMDTSPPGGTCSTQTATDLFGLKVLGAVSALIFLRNRRGFSVSRCINLVGYAQVDEFPLTNVSAGQNSVRVKVCCRTALFSLRFPQHSINHDARSICIFSFFFVVGSIAGEVRRRAN